MGGSTCVSLLLAIVVGCWLLSPSHSFSTSTSSAPIRSSHIAARRQFPHHGHNDGIGGFLSSPLLSPSLSARSSNQLTRPPLIQLSSVPPTEASGSEQSSLFNNKTNGTQRRLRRLSLWVQQVLQLVIRWKKNFIQKVAVLVAAFLFLVPTVPSDATTRSTSPPSPSSSAAVERILEKNEPQNRTGSMPPISGGSSSTKSMSGKTATALTGTVVVLPSAGLALQRARRKDQPQNSNNASQNTDDGTKVPVEGNHGAKPPAPKSNNKKNVTENTTHQHKNKAFVERVLQTAKETRQKYDADTYFKSLQKEKRAISSALKNLKKSAEEKASILSNTKNPVPATPTTSPVATEGAMATLTESTADVVVHNDNNRSSSTNTELPLMTPKFVRARQQPKTAEEETMLADKYKAISDVGERAFQILLDLGMIEQTGGYDDNEEPFQ